MTCPSPGHLIMIYPVLPSQETPSKLDSTITNNSLAIGEVIFMVIKSVVETPITCAVHETQNTPF